MKDYEKQVFSDFSKYANVVEAWSIYDSIVICPSLYGSEVNSGWFTTFNAFGANEQHSLFKTRTQGLVGLPYCNMNSADSMDFAFVLSSVGVALYSPVPNGEGVATPDQDGGAGEFTNVDFAIGHWFAADLPRHMGIQFKVQQDTRIELPSMHCPPGYGTSGGGVSFPGITQDAYGDIPFASVNVSQGVPVLSNRFPLPMPLGIPRTATIEAVLHLSEYARNVLTSVAGPQNMQINSATGAAPYTFFPKRYIIQVSMFGQRLVQQRGQYHN